MSIGAIKGFLPVPALVTMFVVDLFTPSSVCSFSIGVDSQFV